MTMPDDGEIPDAAIEQAADWMFRIEAAPGDAALRSQHDDWLAADDAHVRAWDLARRAWTVSGEVEPAFVGQSRDDGARRSAPHRARRLTRFAQGVSGAGRRRLALGAVAAAALLVVLAPTLSLWLRSDYATATAETRVVRLEDGSQVVLGAHSAIAKRFSDGRRGVELLGGEAWFDVAHDSARPFVVSAADMNVTVTGTAFDVAMTERTLSVAVARGSVRVERGGQPPVRVALAPGQRVSIDRGGGGPSLIRVDPIEIGAWRNHRLAVRDVALADVVETLDRHYQGAILVSGDALKSRQVTGVYDLDDPVRALRTLAGPYGAKVLRITPWLIVVTGA